MQEAIAELKKALDAMQKAIEKLEKETGAAPAEAKPEVKEMTVEEWREVLEKATVQELFDNYLPQRIEAAFERFKDTLAGMEGILQFNITGENGGVWHILIKEGKGEVKKGEHETPTTTFTVDSADWLALVQRKVDPQAIFMSGKLKIAGDMSLAMRLGQIIRGAFGTQ